MVSVDAVQAALSSLSVAAVDGVKENAVVIGTVAATFLGLFMMLTTKKRVGNNKAVGTWLPTTDNIAKRKFESWALHYTAMWIAAFMVVLAFQAYEKFTENEYMYLCVSLALPFLLQPFVYPFDGEKNLPFWMRYSFKANVWIAIFSFVGNYWYTQYFYSVLKASYSFPSHRLNDVPIALYFATHFYFVTYHTFSNLMLRKIETTYEPSIARTLFFWAVVLAFSYFTAFMETLTISSFPYYCFQDKAMMYRVGSAFYGIYFIVSFPTFYRLDEKVNVAAGSPPYTLYQTVYDAMGCSMIVLLLLDFCRLVLNIPLTIGGVGYYVFTAKVPCAALAKTAAASTDGNPLASVMSYILGNGGGR